MGWSDGGMRSDKAKGTADLGGVTLLRGKYGARSQVWR